MSMSRIEEANILGKFCCLWQPGLSALQRDTQTPEWPCCLQLAQTELALMMPLNATVPLALWMWFLLVQEAQCSVRLVHPKWWLRSQFVGYKSGCLSFHIHPFSYKGNTVSQFSSEINIILNSPILFLPQRKKGTFPAHLIAPFKSLEHILPLSFFLYCCMVTLRGTHNHSVSTTENNSFSIKFKSWS